MRKYDVLSTVLITIGALNWGLIGLFNFNLVATIFGEMTFLSRLIYVLVGISGIYELTRIKSIFYHHQGI